MLQSGDDLIIQVFFWSSGLIAGYEAMKASGWRIWVFGGLGAFLILAGFTWGGLKDVSPPFTRWITEIATDPQSWFLLMVIGLVLLSITGRTQRIEKTAPESVTPGESPDEIAEVRGQIDEVSADAAQARREIVTT
jgi:hypothetical protein